MNILVTGGSGFIGTNLVDELIDMNIDHINIDIRKPKKESHNASWRECDILDAKLLKNIFLEMRPSHVIHLAAKTDTEGKILQDYLVNIEGTWNLLGCVREIGNVERLIITSTQFVHQHKGLPKHDEDFAPHTTYGESKVICEQLTRRAGLGCVWTIIRPANIWGPWHPRYAREFWLVLKQGRYIHPGWRPVTRSYGYVGNVVSQILSILVLPPEEVHGEVFYVGDKPMNLYDWVNGFSKALVGRNVIVVPRFIVRSIALFGDMLEKAFRVKFPITSSRYVSMTTDNITPMDKTIQVFGEPPYSFEEGVSKTVEWLISLDPLFWRLNK